jgi:glycolate oxidase FAD binding subunit
MTESLRPTTEHELRDAVAAALADSLPVEIVGAGSRRALGRPATAKRMLDLSALAGIVLYQPDELVLTARAATKLSAIEAALAERNQMLAFEPPDLGPLLGGAAGAGTLGGVVACNLAGPRRLKVGAARDHVLGVRAVTGRGEIVKAGGRVVKNVTGYDLCKLLAGSFGTLAALSEITVKVLPAGAKTRTVLAYGLDATLAVAAMTRALAGPDDVSAAAFLPDRIAAGIGIGRVRDAGVSVTALRIEGPEPSVLARNASLRALLAEFGPVEELHWHNSRRFWTAVGDVEPFAGSGGVVWRLSLPPAGAVAATAALSAIDGAEWYLDWGGGLVWLRLPESGEALHQSVRAAIAPCGGHATLIRAPAAVRAAVSVFQPPPPAVAALSARVKEAFDPQRILNPGRMYEGV